MRNTAKFIGWRSPTLRNKNGLQTFRDKLLTINNKIRKEKEKELYILTQNVNNNNINYNNNSRDSCMVNQKMSISPKLYGPLFKDKTLQKRHVINIHGLQRHDIELYLICLILSFYHSISYNNNNTLINPLTYIDSLKKLNSETYSYIYNSFPTLFNSRKYSNQQLTNLFRYDDIYNRNKSGIWTELAFGYTTTFIEKIKYISRQKQYIDPNVLQIQKIKLNSHPLRTTRKKVLINRLKPRLKAIRNKLSRRKKNETHV